MKIKIIIDGDERENAFLREVFEKGNLDLAAVKCAEFFHKMEFIKKIMDYQNQDMLWKSIAEMEKSSAADEAEDDEDEAREIKAKMDTLIEVVKMVVGVGREGKSPAEDTTGDGE